MTDTNPTILEVMQEDVPDFNKVYLVFMKEVSLKNSIESIIMTLKSDLEKIEFNQTFDLIYDPKSEAYFFKELNNYTKKMICNDLILSNKEFFTKSISVDEYNLLINSVSKTHKEKITSEVEAV